tara:strand:- start:310 stop:522 length:213 start_codon:yes stop_codon:yes gene_type:complete
MRNDYKKHVWMVQSRESRFSVKEKIEDGYWYLVDLEWRDCLTEPTWGKRAAWHANDMENKWTDTRIIKVI